MRVSQLVAEILSEFGAKHIFGVSGGASLHLLKAISDHPNLILTCLHHEQSVAMAADAYSRISNKIGVGVATSGPGATNLITGIAGAYFDSVPVVFLTGQVSTNRMKGETQVRQIGFQETPIVEMVKPITKYAVTLDNARTVESEIRKAISIAQSGRKGPVLIDIPDDIQRIEIELDRQKYATDISVKKPISSSYQEITEALFRSSKPIFVCGAGIQLTSKRDFLISQLKRLSVPTALTWGAKDLLPSSCDFLLGTFGTHGDRYVNNALNNADLIISIGSRLDLKATGSPAATFAPKATKIMIDVDSSEIHKFDKSGLQITHFLNIDFESSEFSSLLSNFKLNQFRLIAWKKELAELQSTFPLENRKFSGAGVNPYIFIDRLACSLSIPANLIVDTGCAIAWTMQAWKTKENQRIFHDFNNTAMGWSIPATIASALASSYKTHICLVGDGSLMMALSDLSTLASLPFKSKIVILNNSGYAMIKQTQDQWFEGDYFASDSGTALKFPNFRKVAEAMNLVYFSAETDSEVNEVIGQMLSENRPLVFEVFIQESARVVPIVKFGNPNHLMEPGLADFSK